MTPSRVEHENLTAPYKFFVQYNLIDFSRRSHTHIHTHAERERERERERDTERERQREREK